MIGVYDYTVILTYLSLVSGCVGMIISMSGLGHPYIGALLLLFSGFCDTFDGRVARRKAGRTEHEKAFGVQIDSFSDLIAFGMLPASIGMAMLRSSAKYSDVPHRVEESGQILWYPVLLMIIALLYVLAAMIRLAYFNVTTEERSREEEKSGASYYTGLPVTAAALVFPLVLVLHYYLRFDFSLVYFGVMLVMAVLFLTNFKLKKPGKKALFGLVALGAAEVLAFICMRFLEPG